MEEKKKTTSIAGVIIYCFCAVIWDVNFFVKLADGYSDTVSFVLCLLCAVTWTACAVLYDIRYIKERKNKK